MPDTQHIQQIVAEAGLCSSASLQLGVNDQSHLGRIYVGGEEVIRRAGIVVDLPHSTRCTTGGEAPLRHAVRLLECGGCRRCS